MKVLMSAYACEPGKGSEPGVGWNWALQASRFHDVWVITRSNNKETIEAELKRNPRSNLRFLYHDLPSWLRLWKRGEQGVRLYYLIWQLTSLFRAHALSRRVSFDIVHHVTFNTIDAASFLWLLGRPFVWGPVGGAQTPPAELRAYFGSRWKYERIRIARKQLVRYNPLVRQTLKRACHVFAANAETEALIRELGTPSLSRELETAVYTSHEAPAKRTNDFDTLHVLWAGRLTLRKGPMLALDAVEEAKRRGCSIKLVFVGDGPLRAGLAEAIAARRLADVATVYGPVPYAQMDRLYSQSDAFLFTSLHDTSGNVILEAMAAGLPVVVLDHHGAADIATSACGFKVPINEPSRVVADIADALCTLANDPEQARRLGTAGWKRANRRFNWDEHGDALRSAYDSCISRGTQR